MKIAILASLAFMAVSAIPNQLTLTTMSTMDVFNAAFAAIGASYQSSKNGGKVTVRTYNEANCKGFPVQTASEGIDQCFVARPAGGSAKMSCSGKDLMLTTFYDSYCQQPSSRQYIPAEINGKCVPSGDGSMSATWDC
jgi:hypothetical protein